MKRRLLLWGIMLVYAFCLMVVGVCLPQYLAVVDKVDGPAWVVREDWSYPLQIGMGLTVGDKIKTGVQGTVIIKFADRHTVNLGPQSVLILKRLDKKNYHTDVSIYLEIGRVMVEVWKKFWEKINFEVESHAAIAGVRGTKFEVKADESGKMEVRVLDGIVELTGKADGTKIKLSSGQISVIALGEKPVILSGEDTHVQGEGNKTPKTNGDSQSGSGRRGGKGR